MQACDQQELEMTGTMAVPIEVGMMLVGGSVLVQVGAATAGMRLTRLVSDLIESREGRGGVIAADDLRAMTEVAHELSLASTALLSRVELERDRVRARLGD